MFGGGTEPGGTPGKMFMMQFKMFMLGRCPQQLSESAQRRTLIQAHL